MGISDMPGYCPICRKLRKNDKEIEKCIESHSKGGKSWLQAMRDKDKKTENEIEKAIEKGEIVRII